MSERVRGAGRLNRISKAENREASEQGEWCERTNAVNDKVACLKRSYLWLETHTSSLISSLNFPLILKTLPSSSLFCLADKLSVSFSVFVFVSRRFPVGSSGSL